MSPFYAEDGLMSLNYNGRWPAWSREKFIETCDNDNGILYKTVDDYQSHLNQDSDYHFPARNQDWIRTQYNIEASRAGYWHRNPGRNKIISSHDNDQAIAAGLILYNRSDIGKYLSKHWFWRNNVDPDFGIIKMIQWARKGKKHHHPIGIHLPHNWVLYSLCGNEKPGWFSLTWLCIYLIKFKYIPLRYESEAQLNWLRIQAIDIAIDKLGFFQKLFYKYARKKWWAKMLTMEGSFRRIYEDPRHPNHI